MTRKLFYVFDMVLLGLLFFSLEHTLIRENVVIDTMLDFALVLRIIIPFLLYRYDRHAIWPVLLFTALFGWTFYSNVFYNTIMNMSGFRLSYSVRGQLLNAMWFRQETQQDHNYVWTHLLDMAYASGCLRYSDCL